MSLCKYKSAKYCILQNHVNNNILSHTIFHDLYYDAEQLLQLLIFRFIDFA